ncbi:putative membrane protein [Sphingomonas sp. UYAg733]
MLSLLLFATAMDLPAGPAMAKAAPASKASAPASAASLFTMVLQHMSSEGRPLFQRYLNQTLLPQARADGEAEKQYRVALQSVVAAPTLDVDAAARLIDQRRQAEAAATASIRMSAFAMIKSLPPADRKLALTAIFADARGAAKKPVVAPAGKK